MSKDKNANSSQEDEVEIPTEYHVLLSRKERYFEQMQSLYDLIKTPMSVSSKELFLLRINELDDLRKSFEACVFNIFEVEIKFKSDASLRSQELKNFDDLYFRTKLYASKLQPSVESVKVVNPTTESRPNLPKLELYSFDGELENFTTFYETFCSLVHNQPNIPKIDKFHYLLSCTKGSALNIVKSVPISANNYDLVWKSLLDKYQDNRLLVGRYLDKMLNFSPLIKESSANLNLFIETFEHSYKAIQALNIKDLNSIVLCHIALRALDPSTRKSFEQNAKQDQIPTFTELMTFIHNQVKVLDHSMSYSSTSNVPNRQNKPVLKYDKNINKVSHNSITRSNNLNKLSCPHCGENHMIFRCDHFRKLTSTQRISRANQLKLCHNCLKQNHEAKDCKSDFRCVVCKKMHNSLLHVDSRATVGIEPGPSQAQPLIPSGASDSPRASNTCHASSMHSYSSVLLGTAVVHVKDGFGCYQPCRVLIDSGAQSNFISSSCLQRLGLPQRKCSFNIFGLAGESVKNHGMTSCVLKPRHNKDLIFNIDAVVLPKLTSDLPNVQVPQSVIKEFSNLFLADPSFYKKSSIDIILAGDIFPHIYDGKKVIINADTPAALGSVFGYVITGKLSVQSVNDVRDVTVVASTTSLVSYTIEEDHLNDTLKRFWEVESEPCSIALSPSEEIAEKIYSEKHYRDETGRYVSPILMKPDHEDLGNSYDVAYKRLTQIERRLARSPDLRKAYGDFMKEYESLDHMELYTGTEPSKYIIPHHCVLRPTSTTTPLRVVFDGSASTDNGLSLNDVLLTGQKLHSDIIKIITNFRLYDVCFTADVSKMYRAVLINPSERKYQHILWRDDPSEPVRIYELKTNTYGLRSAPFVAVRTLHQLARDNPNSSASEILLNGFYVDDLLWSCQSISDAFMLQDELMSLLKSGGFDLKKWSSNRPELLTRMEGDYISKIDFEDDTLSSSLKVLGLTWLPSCDCFSFNYNFRDSVPTKRSVLKLLASIYDPVGFISPCTFVAKCIMQDLWKLGLGWDDNLPLPLQNKWGKFINELPSLADLRIERHLLIPNFSDMQLIGFCDASSRGYAACVYLRSVDGNGKVKVRLICSKSKVAPLKPIMSIPRLELMAAVLLTKLITFIKQNVLADFNGPTFAFSDSSVVLSWLHTPPYKLKTFVSSRVSQIIDAVPPNCWRHINSENNAADSCSRGALPQQFVEVSTEWINGPKWLYNKPQDWPTNTFFLKDDSKLPELKSNVDTFCFNSCDDQTFINDLELTFNNFSSFNKLQRVMAWCHRFINNLKNKLNKTIGPLNSSELKQGHDSIITTLQINHFNSEIKDLKKNGYAASLRKLSPFIDTLQFLRVGGRISQSDLSYNMKHPVLLPKKCHTTSLIIKYYHELYLHIGPRTLQGILCKKYWIINARSIIRSVLSKCVQCFRCRPSVVQPIMGTLPASRLMPDKVFNHVGCDLGGPFFVKESLRRNAKVHKAYLCLFICFSTKAVHLEVLTDLSCECFLAAFDRFVSRRGLCSCLYSDCGTNFIAAAKHLKDVHEYFSKKECQDKILDGLTSRSVQWRKLAPNSASMGGLWEAGIKSAKYHLSRAVGDRSLTFEELTTIFCKIEAIMNSRPLCSLSNNPEEFDVLTAGHFLVGQNLLAVPEYQFEDVPLNRLSRWQLVQKTSQAFWKRWSDDYLHTLQQREKWFSSSPNVKVGDLVLLKSNLTRPLQWPRARIEQVHPGPDNVVRVVTVKTQNGLFKRPVNKLCPLPHAN